MGQKERAYRALQEAVKCNFENWKVWDNLKNVSADCGQFEEVHYLCLSRLIYSKVQQLDLAANFNTDTDISYVIVLLIYTKTPFIQFGWDLSLSG